MEDLIKALQILAKYANKDENPTHCVHHEFLVYCGIKLKKVSEQDREELEKLSFFWNKADNCFVSFRFGCCCKN